MYCKWPNTPKWSGHKFLDIWLIKVKHSYLEISNLCLIISNSISHLFQFWLCILVNTSLDYNFHVYTNILTFLHCSWIILKVGEKFWKISYEHDLQKSWTLKTYIEFDIKNHDKLVVSTYSGNLSEHNSYGNLPLIRYVLPRNQWWTWTKILEILIKFLLSINVAQNSNFTIE